MANSIEIKQCFLVNNDCYKQGRHINPTGIVVHSTGANNPYIKRYVQPDDGILGHNSNNNHWNRSGITKCVHAFIGKDKNGNVRIYQTLPWDYRCWGCGSGSKGSYNNNYIQFEICEDALSDINYFNDVFMLAIKLCSYLRDKYNFSVNNIVSHHESYTLGYGSNHSDCDHWLKKFGKNMDWFRGQVTSECGITTKPTTNTTPIITTYTKTQFIKDVQSAIGVTANGIVDAKTLSALPTVSKSKNNRHAVVKPLQKYFNVLGFDCGNADGVAGTKFDTAAKAWAKENGCMADGEFTAGGKSWKVILGCNTTSSTTNSMPTTTSKYVYDGIDYAPVFDPTYYANKYSDLKRTFGTNATALFKHFCTYGMTEGRIASANFNVMKYKENYVDLQKAFGDNYPEYYKHYCQFGKKEGRKAV